MLAILVAPVPFLIYQKLLKIQVVGYAQVAATLATCA